MDFVTYDLDELFKLALDEDIGAGDITTTALIEKSRQGSVVIKAKQDLVCCGQPVAKALCSFFDSTLKYQELVADGVIVSAGTVIAELTGSVASILTLERALLNFLQRLSGIASLTAQYLEQLKATKVLLLDTRKTAPGWRVLEKYAVSMGGGTNHRFGLYDAYMVKDNHLDSSGLSIVEAVERCKAHNSQQLKITVEVRNQQELEGALISGADRVLLDNMSPEQLRQAVQYAREKNPQVFLEASGGVNLANIATVAATGVDGISVGALTHSAPVADISMLYHFDQS